jgi:hypothetical protein
MALTKKKLQELIRELKGGGDASENSKYHPQVVNEAVEIVRNSIILEEITISSRRDDHSINSQFFSKVDLKIVTDHYGRSVAELPVRIISLKKDRGLRSVAPTAEIECGFSIVENGAISIIKTMEIADLAVYVYMEGNCLVVVNAPEGLEEITATVIKSLDNFDENEVIPLPAGYEENFIQRVIEFFEEEKLTTNDKYNDSNSNQNDVQ